MKTNPLNEIKKDIAKLAQMAIDYASQLPEDSMQVEAERKIRRVLKTYRFRVKELPKFRATTK